MTYKVTEMSYHLLCPWCSKGETLRVVAEQLLGRPLRPGEVVHHIDGNKRNNRSENLRVFSSQAEHAKFHAEFNWFINELRKMGAIEGGDAE